MADTKKPDEVTFVDHLIGVGSLKLAFVAPPVGIPMVIGGILGAVGAINEGKNPIKGYSSGAIAGLAGPITGAFLGGDGGDGSDQS